MGQAASQSVSVHSLPQGATRYSGGSLRTYAHSLLSAGLFVTGLALWLWPSGAASQAMVLWAHLGAGAALIGLLLPWLLRHVTRGLRLSQRRTFTLSSWALLALWIVLVLSGLVATFPAVLWAFGPVWFPAREASGWLSFLHFWSSWLAMAGLGLHLAQRHWVWGAK